MNFWKQVPNATKIYLVITLYLVMVLCGLVVIRQIRSDEGGFSLGKFWRYFNRNETGTATAVALTPQPTATFAPNTAWLRARTNVQIFDGPGKNFPNIAWLEGDQVAEIIGKTPDESWWALKLPYLEKGQGWVAADQVEVNNPAGVKIISAAGTSEAAATPTNLAKVKAIANINIRSGPDLKYRKIGTLELDQSAEVVGISPDSYWWLIKVPGTDNLQGWISKDYALAQNADNVPIIDEQSGAVSTLTSGSAYLTANTTVNVRSGPDVTYEIIGTLEQGKTAEIVGRTEDGIWWAIRYPGAQDDRGWVAAAYVKAENTQNVPVIR